jgi:ABC-type antimicrobial peptide transport system permease subunit
MSVAGMEIVEGRDFRPTDMIELVLNKTSEPTIVKQNTAFNVIVTESLARQLGKGSAIGKMLQLPGQIGGKDLNLVVTGVIKDYVYGDMYGQSSPVIFYCIPQLSTFMYVRMKPGRDPEQVLAKMSSILKKENPGYPFQYRFVDDQFNALFMNEMLISKLSRVFSMLAILISCLGLFGLAAYTAERRRKEIGIRRVLGASVTSVSTLLSKEFLGLVLASCLVAFPLAWWVMSRWLQGYAYRINISPWVFAGAAIAAIAISLLTVSWQAIRAALANPTKSLRSE